jgi:hypothetical protein
VLEPVLEKVDGKVTNLKIKQSLPIRGKSKIHAHKLNICFFDSEAKHHIIRDVVVSGKSEFT